MLEYALLGLIAGLIGSLAAMALSYAISVYVFELDWQFAPAVYIIGTAVTILLVTVVGALSSLSVLNRKPLAVLRAQ